MRQKSIAFLVMILAIALLSQTSPAQTGAKNKGKPLYNTAQEPLKPEQLPQIYKSWYELVSYISTREEKRAFLSLRTEADRDAFIRIFWQQRDPTPGTPENEYKNEIEARFAYANENYRRGATRPGWMTDMGQMHIILGKPNSIERLDNRMGLYPVQIWYYYGDKTLGLPTYFHLLFYRPNGAGEWKLYDPNLDGPAALLIKTEQIDDQDFQDLYRRLHEISPTLVDPAFSLIPNDINSTYKPSPRSNFIFATILESPTKKINMSYATNFLKYKGFVNVESSVNFIENSNLISVTRNSIYGFNMINITARPKKISVGYNSEKDKYFFNFNMNVSLRNADDIPIYQYTKNFEFYIPPDQVKGLESNGLVIHDSFPAVPGKYQITVYLENAVGKEFTYFDSPVTIPAQNDIIVLSDIVLGYKVEEQPDNFIYSYKFINKKLFVDTDRTVGLAEKPTLLLGVYNLNPQNQAGAKVVVTLNGLSERNKVKREWTIALKDQPPQRDVNILFPLEMQELRADYYELTVKLYNAAGALSDTKNLNFTLSPLQKLGRPIDSFKRSNQDNPFSFYYALAMQYDNLRQDAQAEAAFEKCMEANPQFVEAILAYLNLENRLKKYDKVLQETERLKGNDKHRFDYFRLRGAAYFGKGEYTEALKMLNEANTLYNSDIRVINLLGYTFLKLNDLEQAEKAFQASLQMNKNQPEVEKLLPEIAARRKEGAVKSDGKK